MMITDCGPHQAELNRHKVDHESDQSGRAFGPADAGLKTLVWPRAAGCAGGRSYQPRASRIAEVRLYRYRIGPRDGKTKG